MMVNDCPDCRDKNNYCKVHQKHEKAVYEGYRDHGTQEFRMAIHDARTRDMEATK